MDSQRKIPASLPKIDSVANPRPSPPVIRAQAPELGWMGVEREMAAPRCPLRAPLRSAGELAWGADETLAQLEKVLHLYRSGQYLQNSTAGSQAGEWPL